MFKFICLFALISAACAASIGSVESTTERRPIVPLIKYERENNPDGSFKFSYEGGDQTQREEVAHVVDAGTEDEALEVSGSYRYIDEEGRTVEVHYTAGKNGFVPVGTNILPEISAAAKAAATLPHVSEEEYKRKGRSHSVKEVKAEEAKVEEVKVEEAKVEEPQVVAVEEEVHTVEEPKVEETKVEEVQVQVEELPAPEVHEAHEEEPKTETA